MISLKRLGDVVMAVDQRRAFEDSIDPRLRAGVNRLGVRASGSEEQREAKAGQS